MLNKNTNHLFFFVVTVQFHIAHLYEIQVSLFSFTFSFLLYFQGHKYFCHLYFSSIAHFKNVEQPL